MVIYKSNRKNINYKSRYIDSAPFRGIKISEKTRIEKLTLLEKCLALQELLPENVAFSHSTAIYLLNIGTPWGIDTDEIIHLTIINNKKRIRRPNVKTHYIKIKPTEKIPIIKINGLRVVAPELLWFSMVRELTLQESVVLGSLFVSNNHELTTLKKISNFVNTRYNCNGHKLALKQLKQIIVGTDSPMETRIHTQIKKFGLPNFQPNYPICIDDEIIMLADGALPDKKICFEYDGREFHSEPAKMISDKRKRSLVFKAGWSVIVLTYEDYLNPQKYIHIIEELLE
ncbi:MAG: hypothetical protein LBN03_00070 [Bifidobacteriaceae bacterium]|jgi:hypothetical protein|nr:hypothetical protein [Bifidobacteriaceae bacterium]